MRHRISWLPVLLGSVGLVSFNAAVAQVASGSMWGMGTEQAESELELEPSGPQIAPAHLWGFGGARTDGGAVAFAADQGAQFVGAPAPNAAVRAVNYADSDTAVLVKAFAQQGVAAVEDDLDETGWSRGSVRVAAADWGFSAPRDERPSPDRQAAGLFAPASVSYAQVVTDEALTVDIVRPKNRPVAPGPVVLSNRSLSIPNALLSDDQAMASVTRRRKRAASYRQTAGLAAPTVVSLAPVVADEALTVDILRPRNRPVPRRPDVVSTKSLVLPKALLPVDRAMASITRKRKGVSPYRNAAGLLASAAVSYEPSAAVYALAVDIGRLKNSPPTHSSDVMFTGSLGMPTAPKVAIELAMASATPDRENATPDGQFAAQFAPLAVSSVPSATDETLTVDIGRLENSPPSYSADVMFTGSLGTPTAPKVAIELAMAAATPERENVIPDRRFAPLAASYASFTADENLNVDIVPLKSSPPPQNSNFLLSQRLGTSSGHSVPIQRALKCGDCSSYVRGKSCCVQLTRTLV